MALTKINSEELLVAAAERITNHSISFVKAVETPKGFVRHAAGSGTLVIINGTRCILTAEHVVKSFPQKIGINIGEKTALEIDSFYEKIGNLDLAIVFLTPSVAGTLSAKKSFYNLDSKRPYPHLAEDTYMVSGAPLQNSKDDSNSKTLTQTHWTWDASLIKTNDLTIEIKVTADKTTIPKTYSGVSGGGVWRIIFIKESKKEINTNLLKSLEGAPQELEVLPLLEAVACEESDDNGGGRTILATKAEEARTHKIKQSSQGELSHDRRI